MLNLVCEREKGCVCVKERDVEFSLWEREGGEGWGDREKSKEEKTEKKREFLSNQNGSRIIHNYSAHTSQQGCTSTYFIVVFTVIITHTTSITCTYCSQHNNISQKQGSLSITYFIVMFTVVITSILWILFVYRSLLKVQWFSSSDFLEEQLNTG